MWKRSFSFLAIYLLLSNELVASVEIDEKKILQLRETDEELGCSLWDAIPYILGGAGAAVAFGPSVLEFLGFTKSGITAKSVASHLMKWTATMSGGGVPAGGSVAKLQSLGATSSKSELGTLGAKLGYKFHEHFICKKKK
ncbi:interferon alpha-inducible protein 6-like [Protopterus annectens]|uniref:interferon alpha-inducible protein 6-like n=1 Tax=Protopterus annectens TaxID=7888 RepID=UPI001CF9717F|nr:interferon alpha-inducible protein 6-like [Protopterus annectens]